MKFYSISVLGTKCTNFGTFDSYIILMLLIVHNMSGVSSQTGTSKPIRNMETIEVNSEPVFEVIVNRDNNDIIVGARNAIYKLSPNDLQKNDEFITGPVNDSSNCLPSPAVCETGKPLVNNDNQILLIKYDNKDFPLLLACGDANQGMCHMLKATNLSFNKVYGLPNDTMNFIGSKSSSFAFLAPSSSASKDVLYVAHSYDGRPLNYSPPSISSRRFNGLNGFALAYNSSGLTQIDIHSKYKQTFNVNYLYGFNYTQYSYFLSTQPINLKDTQEYETKLIRICQNDNQFFSYMEIPLICSEDENYESNNSENNGKSKGVIYYIATSAYFGKIGTKMAQQLNINNQIESHTLFISFIQTINTSFNKTVSSAVCAFSIKKINRAFTAAAEECFRGSPDVDILESITGQKRECQKYNSQVNDDFCGTGLNPYIGTKRPLNGVFLNSIQGHVTSLAVAVQHQYSVAAIGTKDGRIMKVVIGNPDRTNRSDRSAAQKPIFEMNLSDQLIRPNSAFDNKEKYLYLLSGNQLIKFPFGSCSLHTDCTSCLDESDPLKCGWCGSYCATDEECMEPTLMSKSMCPPEVFDFNPKSGPVSGGTIVTIAGDNFGYPHESAENSEIKITIAGSECEVISRQPRRVQCKTKAVEKELSGLIQIYVHDLVGRRHGRAYDINGTAQSREEFKYLEPRLLGVYPSFGPFGGGTNVTIVGQNLHIGSKRYITLAGIECKEVDNNSTFLSCISGRFNSSPAIDPTPKPSDDTSVKVLIDDKKLIVNQNRTVDITPEDIASGLKGKEENWISSYEWTEFFVYKPNPAIFSIEPKSTIRSGSTNIIVRGNNLNSVKNPRMQVLAISRITKEEIRTITSCEVNESGTKMVCKTPPIRDPISPPKIKVPIETQISFVMDGIKNFGLTNEQSRLIYFPDPSYYPFTEDNNLRIVYIEEPILKIDGKDLTADYPIDIKISGQIPCNLTDSNSFDAIYCVIEYDENFFKVDDREHLVDIRVGKLHFSPGKVRFAIKPSNTSVGTIMVSTLVPILVMAIIVAAVMYYLKSRGVILVKKYPPHSVIYTPGDIESGERPGYLPQHSRNDYVRGDVSHPLLPVEGAIGGLRYQASEETMALLREHHILLERNHIALEDVIGQGHFGCVYKGILYSPEKELEREVAVKTLHSSSIREEMDIDSFLQEGIMMKDFKHHHVLTLIGVCFEDDGLPIVILPYMENGDLLSYIRDEKNMPTVKNLLTFAIEIAKGMDYLSSQKFVHRDLAARNCMLDSGLVVKVADFGLSRDIYERDYYSSDNKKCKLPVKWMSPESLEKGTYNTKTDVWSYGVLVWELLTRGVTPYPDVDNWEILNYLKQGRRMPRPLYCPELLYLILLKCWSEEPKSRPTFSELCDEVQGVITKLEKGTKKQKVEINLSNTYVNYPIPNTYANDSQAVIEESNKQKPSVYETTC